MVLPRTEKVTYDDAKPDLRAYYETHKTRDVAEGRPGPPPRNLTGSPSPRYRRQT